MESKIINYLSIPILLVILVCLGLGVIGITYSFFKKKGYFMFGEGHSVKKSRSPIKRFNLLLVLLYLIALFIVILNGLLNAIGIETGLNWGYE